MARRWAGAANAAAADTAVWIAAGLGLLAARAGQLLRHADAYAASPIAVLDLRDGGWFAPAGWVAAGLWLAWRVGAAPPLRRALGAAALVGLVLWNAGTLALQHAGGGADAAVPEIALSSLQGDRVLPLPALLAGQPTVVNLWASWCGPCRSEMPMLAAAQQRERGVRFLFVNQGETAASVQAYLQREGLALDGVWLDCRQPIRPGLRLTRTADHAVLRRPRPPRGRTLRRAERRGAAGPPARTARAVRRAGYVAAGLHCPAPTAPGRQPTTAARNAPGRPLRRDAGADTDATWTDATEGAAVHVGPKPCSGPGAGLEHKSGCWPAHSASKAALTQLIRPPSNATTSKRQGGSTGRRSR